MRYSVVLLVLCLCLTVDDAWSQDPGTPSRPGFNADIQPLLSQHCFACHGPDSASRKADLRLDVRVAAIAAGAIKPGAAAESELIKRINSDDPEVMMPPPDVRRRLTAQQKQLLKRWIDEGAAWEQHWAFLKPRRAAVPQPKGVAGWAHNAVDHFVLQRMGQLGLQPNPAAERYVLARRAALDITGLPPDAELLKSFVNDQRPDAYERYVDTLLASEHAGEHRARYWLDAARYGDTHGMHVDNYREIWPYRDWVIQAFNHNMPFDQFVIEQIAGDLLPQATLEQRIATGFNRCNITTSEGGAIPAELDVRYMIDRVETTSTVFLGLTTGCAVCHDHKYDPITQRDFYRLGAFFNNSTQPAMDGNQKDTPPVVTLPADEFAEEWQALSSRRQQLRSERAQYKSRVQSWWPSRTRQQPHPVADDGLLLWMPLTAGEDESFQLPKAARWASEHPAGARGVRFAEKAEFSTELPQLRSDQPLTISFWYRTPDRLMTTTLFTHTAKTKDGKVAGWKISGSTQGALTFELTDPQGQKIRALLPGEEALTPRAWQHVCVRYSGGQSNSSITILVNGKPGRLRNSTESHVAATELVPAPLKIATSLPTAGLSDIRIFRRWLGGPEVRLLAAEFQLKQLIDTDAAWENLEARDQRLLTEFYNEALDEDYRGLSRAYDASERRHDFIYARSTTTLVSQERSTPPRAWVLERGEYDQRREQVAPGIPAVLQFPGAGFEPGQQPAGDRSPNRYNLARWLVHPDHPLTARVTVNRLWQSMFGVGLVKTSEDFGVMGERPSHPELLDWLAVEFVESGWDVRHILKLMLTSATYRQSGRATPEKLNRDRDNRLLARGPRLRLDAEVLRDQALAVGGLLQKKLGGPAVRPYQPVGLWRVVAITGSNTRDFKRDTGEALYRRSVYTFWKRTSPPPSMAAFNAPTREQCTVRRERTNTPLQALVLMNDPQFVESARHLAEISLTELDAADDRGRARWMLSRILSRPARDADVVDVAASVAELRGVFGKHPEMAGKLIKTGDSVANKTLDAVELAAWTMIANTLMNRDDFINK